MVVNKVSDHGLRDAGNGLRLDDGEVTAKHIVIEDGGQVMLWFSNTEYEDIRVSGQVLGRVVWHIRRM